MQWRSQVFFSLLLAIPQALRPHNFRLIETTVLVVQPRWSGKSCAPGDLAAQGYGPYPGMRRLRIHHSWVVNRASEQTSSIDKYFEQTSPSVSPGRQLSEANARFVEGQSQKTLVFLINASRSVLCIIVYSITICRGVTWPPNLGRL